MKHIKLKSAPPSRAESYHFPVECHIDVLKSAPPSRAESLQVVDRQQDIHA